MWVKFLMDLREDELLFTAFQSSIERTQETINPLMLAASQQMAVNMLDRLLMESQLSLDKPSPGINEDQIAAMKQLLATCILLLMYISLQCEDIKKHSEDAEEEEEENKPELPSEEDSLEKRFVGLHGLTLTDQEQKMLSNGEFLFEKSKLEHGRLNVHGLINFC